MKFIDEVDITVASGRGGDGATSFRREKYVPLGGPDGGDGGDGGDLYLIADRGISTLASFRGKKNYSAGNGEAGAGRQRNGKAGDSLEVMVPMGTLIKKIAAPCDTGTLGNSILADLTKHGEKVLLAQGGRGGLGNTHFKSSTNQAPRYAQKGKDAQVFNIRLELKLLAEMALIGLPNAGKSTLLSRISNARPLVADYPFTTLNPKLAVTTLGEKSWTVVDVPGLIEGAGQGRGLGHKFLKHIERTYSLIHLVDCSSCLEPFEAFENYITIRRELEDYPSSSSSSSSTSSPSSQTISQKKEVVCLSKVDAMTESEVERFVAFFEKQLHKKVLPISSVSGKNIDKIKQIMLKIVTEKNSSRPDFDFAPDPDPNRFNNP